VLELGALDFLAGDDVAATGMADDDVGSDVVAIVGVEVDGVVNCMIGMPPSSNIYTLSNILSSIFLKMLI